ncbi:MAG: hypothetical protein K2X38_07255 [Gemmataceae bacterium]|nr:hypothetical protein [Gemmataceae bacterium]
MSPLRRLVFLCVCISLSGCTEVTRTGDKAIWTFAPWVGLLVLLGALVGIAGGFLWLVFRDKWTGIAGTAFFVILGVIAAPAMFTDFCEVTPEGFHLRTGIWFAPNEHRIRFDEVDSIHMTTERGRRSSSTFLVSNTRQGQVRTPVGDLMRHGPIDDIIAQVRRRGIPFTR